MKTETSEFDPMLTFYIDFLLGYGETIEGGQERATYTNSAQLTDFGLPRGLAFDVWSVMPHMHEAGRELNARVIREDGSDMCMAQVNLFLPANQSRSWVRVSSQAWATLIILPSNRCSM